MECSKRLGNGTTKAMEDSSRLRSNNQSLGDSAGAAEGSRKVFRSPFARPRAPLVVGGRTIAAASTVLTLEQGERCEYGSLEYFVSCAVGGALSCGLTHSGITPLDIVKCRLQVDREKYRNTMHGFKISYREGGLRGLTLGWAPALFGYSMQGLGKFGLYELFKLRYSEFVGPEIAYEWRTSVYLAASASAEFFADLLLCPMEAVKVRMQTQPGFASTLREGWPKYQAEEGFAGFYKGIIPLWLRQIPYTMMKFACFERTLEALYKYVVPKPRSQCTKGEQLLVTFSAGYIAGVFCALVSHPADTVISKVNKDKTATLGGIIQKVGFWGLWQGLMPRILMIGTLTAAQWFIYDGVKVWLSIPRPPPPEMPESLKRKYSQ